jgi:hypothetical protein
MFKNDISKVSFDEARHYLGVFHQMGRVALDADLNEQNEIGLRLLQRLAGDAVHTGSPNEGFRVETHTLLDRVDTRRGWDVQPAGARAFVDYFEHRYGDGALALRGCTGATRTLAKPWDLTGLSTLLLWAKKPVAAPLQLTVGDGTTTHTLATNVVFTDTAGWTLLSAPPGAWPAALAVDRITHWGLAGLDAARDYTVDALLADLPLTTLLVDPERTALATAQPAGATLAADDDQRLWQRRSLRVTGATTMACALPAPTDASRARALLVSLRRDPAAAALAVRLVDGATPNASITLTGATVFTQGGWEVHRFVLPQAGAFDWATVQRVELGGLSPAATYHLGPVLLEANPAQDLVVMGGDGTAEGAGRFHGDGLAAVKESTGTYFTQADLPGADPAALAPVAEGEQRIDWAYLDLWERPLAFTEAPTLRDVALGGVDTTTRTQLVAQVRLLRGTPVPLAGTPAGPAADFAALQRLGQGVLSTKDRPAAVLDLCADPCEPAIDGPYLGEDNRLFRVEIHQGGDIGLAGQPNTARFKWARDNAATVTPLIADAPGGATSVTVEQPELFQVGDLIELSNDQVELIAGPYEDRLLHRRHGRGPMRRITSINLDTRRLGWERAGPMDPLHTPLAMHQVQRLALHAKVTRWDGLADCVTGDLTLTDGVVIEFGGQALAPGDFWLFATRTADRSVERLIEAPPRGTRHAFYKLAAIHRRREAGQPERVFCEDLRPRLAALSELDASRVAFDPGAGAGQPGLPADWGELTTVQQAIDALAQADLTRDMRLHNKLLHGMGVICGLQLRCLRSDRSQIVIQPGYALDCEGNLLRNSGDLRFNAVTEATPFLDATRTGRVNLWITRGANGVRPHVEAHTSQGFWDEVLEGSLLKDFIDKVVMPLLLFGKVQLTPFPDNTVPLSDAHRRMITVINLLWQLINPSTGRYLWLSPEEHELLERLHDDFVNLLGSQGSYCALFDHLTPFPSYPYNRPAGISTSFGALALHRRLKLDASGRWAATAGFGNRVQVFDLSRGEAAVLVDFPFAANAEVLDVAFSTTAAGVIRLHAVASIRHSGHADSVFANATLTPPVAPALLPTFAWDATGQTVCDTEFVSLATHPARPGWLYAIGRHPTDATRRGLYRFDPQAVPLAPSPAVVGNAVGLLDIDTSGADAAFALHTSAAVQDGSFDSVLHVALGTMTVANNFNVSGRRYASGTTPAEDLALAGGIVYVTGLTGGMGSLLRFRLSPAGPLLPSLMFTAQDTWRLAVVPSRNLVALSGANACAAMLIDTSGANLQWRERVPLQIAPAALATAPGGRQVHALNAFSGTVNTVDLATVHNTPAPSYTAIPPTSLTLYRLDVLKSFTDLIGVVAQYLKDGFFDRFLVDCPDCGPDDKVYLGVLEINNGRVDHICNFGKRHYAKSFRTWGYWLSAVPLLPMLKTALKKIACVKLVP